MGDETLNMGGQIGLIAYNTTLYPQSHGSPNIENSSSNILSDNQSNDAYELDRGEERVLDNTSMNADSRHTQMLETRTEGERSDKSSSQASKTGINIDHNDQGESNLSGPSNLANSSSPSTVRKASRRELFRLLCCLFFNLECFANDEQRPIAEDKLNKILQTAFDEDTAHLTRQSSQDFNSMSAIFTRWMESRLRILKLQKSLGYYGQSKQALETQISKLPEIEKRIEAYMEITRFHDYIDLQSAASGKFGSDKFNKTLAQLFHSLTRFTIVCAKDDLLEGLKRYNKRLSTWITDK